VSNRFVFYCDNVSNTCTAQFLCKFIVPPLATEMPLAYSR
jgi:hypothetical protein